jgi:3-oxoacyl-(acyl-carrier-protein) synthase
MQPRRVVVSGLGSVSPAGVGCEALWRAVAAGTSMTKSLKSVTSSELFGSFDFESDSIAEVPGFEQRARRLPAEVQRLDRFVQLAVAAADEAIENSGIMSAGVDMTRVGITLSTAICGTPAMESEFLAVTDRGRLPIDPRKAGRDLYLSSMSNTPGIILATLLGAQGPCFTLSTGCVGGIDAIGAAYDAIRYGDADVMIAGASEAPITPITIASFEVIGCLSTNYRDRPEAASRPYDAQRNGFVLGEGCGIVVLEELDHARRRGATAYMEVCGFSHTSNATHMTDLLSDGSDLARAMSDAIDEAGLPANAVQHVSSHGSSTPQNDSCETSALKLALGESARTIPVNSAKSMLGHALSAASAMEIVLCALAFKHSFVHPTANYENFDPQCDLDYVPNAGREWDGDVILKEASGFAGLHAAMVLRAMRNEAER